MRGDETSRAARGIDRGIELALRERRLRLAVGSPTGIGVDLDPSRAMLDLIADRSRDAINTVGLLRALRHLDARREAAGPIRSRRDDRARGDEEARSRNDPLIDRLLEADVGVTGAFRPEVAKRRESRFQRALRGNGGPCHAKRERLPEYLIG